MRISVYLLNKNRDIEEYVKDAKDIYKYKLNIEQSNNIEGYFVYQQKRNELDWITKINRSKWLKKELDNTNIIKRGFLLFKLSESISSEEKPAIFLISFNGGINLVKNIYVDYNFGYELASKLISQNRIRKYGSTDIHENIIKTDKNSSNYIPRHLIGEKLIISTIDSITGYSDGKDFISGDKGLILNYTDEFNNGLIESLEYLYLEYIYSEKNEDIYNRFKKVKNIEEINMLNEKLCEVIQDIKLKFISNRRELHKPDLRDVSITVDFSNKVMGYKYTGISKSTKIYDEIDEIEYFEQLSSYLNKNEINNEKLLNKLKRDKIIAIKDDSIDIEDSSNEECSVYNSLVVKLPNGSTKDNEKTGMLISGNWYYVNNDYYSALSDRLQSKVIADNQLNGFSFIDFNKNKYDVEKREYELKYNEELAEVNNGLLLDEKLFNIGKDIKDRKYNGRSSIEPCDVLLYSDKEQKYYFIHCKINSNTQGISHLSTQANISTSLLLDLETSDKLIGFINKEIEEKNCLYIPKLEEVRNDNICVILAIIEKEHDKNLKTIFTILKLQALDNCIARLEQLGVEVKIKLIRDSSN